MIPFPCPVDGRPATERSPRKSVKATESFRLVKFNDYYSFTKNSTAKLPVYQKPYPLELIFFVVPHRQSANFSLRKRRTLHKNHLPNKTIRYNLKPAPGSRPRTSYACPLLWSELSWCKAPPPRQGGARSEGFFNFGVCVSSYSYCSSYPCVWVWSIPQGGSGPVPVAHAQTQRTSEAPASRRSTRKRTQNR